MFPFSRALTIKGNSSTWLFSSVMFRSFTMTFLYQIPETCNEQSPVYRVHPIHPSLSQVLPQAPAHGKDSEKHFRAQAEVPDMVWPPLPSSVFLKVSPKTHVLVRQNMSVPKAPKVIGSRTGHEGPPLRNILVLGVTATRTRTSVGPSLWSRRAHACW